MVRRAASSIEEREAGGGVAAREGEGEPDDGWLLRFSATAGEEVGEGAGEGVVEGVGGSPRIDRSMRRVISSAGIFPPLPFGLLFSKNEEASLLRPRAESEF